VKIRRFDEWQISPRVTLRAGDKFRVGAGPYWRLPDGTKQPMGTRGVCVFLGGFHHGSRTFIEARDGSGFTLIHVAGRRRNRDMPQLVCRPHKIRCRVTGKAGAR
jgi:hypothetical protein